MHVTIISPKRYWPKQRFIQKAEELAEDKHLSVTITEDIDALTSADIVATDTWVSLWDEDTRPQRLQNFQGYTVTPSVMMKANKDAIFMHCMPIYYGEEVTREVAHGPQSVIIDEAENRLWTQMALLITLLR